MPDSLSCRSRRLLAAGLALCAFAAPAAFAQAEWPQQPVTLIMGFPAGSGVDVVARTIQEPLQQKLGQPVVIDYKSGAAGNIASEYVARAKPDGYTLLVQVSTLVMNKSLYKSLAYDPLNDFAPVSLTSWGTLLLVTNPSVQKTTSVAQVVAAAKASPGKLTYATPGVGTPHHLSMALLLQSTGTEMLHVPYKGTAGAVTDLLGGRIDYMFLPVHVALQHIQAGKLKAIATGSDQRLAQLPEVPTLAEAGIQGGNVDMWYGVLAPKGTPGAVVARLNKEIAAVLKQPEVATAFQSQGMVPAASTPADFGKLIDKDAARWAAVVSRGGITAE